jgi:hypothetical protein
LAILDEKSFWKFPPQFLIPLSFITLKFPLSLAFTIVSLSIDIHIAF